MRGNLALAGLGIGFILLGAALAALTLRKSKPSPANPSKAQQRELAALAEEKKKMWIGAGSLAGFGLLLLLIS